MNNKGGDFIVKKTDYNTVFVPEEWNEEQKMLKQMINAIKRYIKNTII